MVGGNNRIATAMKLLLPVLEKAECRHSNCTFYHHNQSLHPLFFLLWSCKWESSSHCRRRWVEARRAHPLDSRCESLATLQQVWEKGSVDCKE